MANELSAKRCKRLKIQGYGDYTAAQLLDLQFGIRFAYAACTLLAIVGVALMSIPILSVLMVLAFLGMVLPNHPFDYLYNYIIRHIINRPHLPPRTEQTRFACMVASIWLAITIVLFWQGMDTMGVIWGSLLIMVAGLVTVTDICIPSMIYNLFKYKKISP